MKELIYKNGQGFAAICAVNDLASVEKMVGYVRRCLKIKNMDTVPLVVGINKMDLDEKEHVVSQEIVKKALKEIGVTNLSIFNTSAKTGENIESMFFDLVRKCRVGSYDVFEILQKIIDRDIGALEDATKETTRVVPKENKKNCSFM